VCVEGDGAARDTGTNTATAWSQRAIPRGMS
jgi:hypothetical protein